MLSCRNLDTTVTHSSSCILWFQCLLSSCCCWAAKPRMTHLPEKRIEVSKGSPITLTCKASGHPKPNIEWRYNMERIPSTFPRISVCTSCSNCTENEALSSLTLIEFDEGLEGKWTCEAVNSVQSIVSPHDTELRLRPSPNYVSGVY